MFPCFWIILANYYVQSFDGKMFSLYGKKKK